MNRKAISILAILALLCTMFTFAMPATAEATASDEAYKGYPKYALHESYPGETNWTIQDAADWKAMMATADATAAGKEYFKDHTFHLLDDVDFSQTEWLLPMGAGRYFGGTINGHGFGFENFKICERSGLSTSGETVTGMFYRLGNCAFVDFGVNSGTIIRANDNALSCTTTFGGLVDGYTPSFTRVWSGAYLYHTSSGMVSGLASSALGAYKNDIKVNGFVFDGRLSVYNKHGFSLIGSLEDDRIIEGDFEYTNIITDAELYSNGKSQQVPYKNGAKNYDYDATFTPTESAFPLDGSVTPRYSMVFSAKNTTTIKNSNFENLYTVSYPNVRAYYGRTSGTAVRTADETMMASSAFEAAWTANKKPSKKAEAVYFTLKNDKIRPVAEDTKMIVKVTLTGDVDREYFLNANTEYDLAAIFGKKNLQTFEIKEDSLSSISGDKLSLGKEDVVIEVSADCDHAGSVPTKGANANEHIRVCALCGYDKVETCSAANPTPNAITEEKLAAGEKATHSGTCDFCHGAFTVDCEVDYVLSAEANKEAYWDYSACACGRENVEHSDTAIVSSGDATGDGEIDLLDAVRILRKFVQTGEVEKERNADVDGDNAIKPQDALLAIRIWFGNLDAINTASATENRINAENLFDSKAVTKQSLTMDGTEGNVAGYVVTNPIAVHADEKLSFGPVRLSAPVMGYFYDAEGNPLQLINHTNAKVGYTFEEGKALVSIDVPANAETVRFQMATEEIDQFYLRVNTEITGMDYEKRFENAAVENPLKGRTFLTVGDSLCAAANDAYVGNAEIGYMKGWARRIRDIFGAKVTNSSKGGSTLCTEAMSTEQDTGLYIFNQLNQHSGDKNFDYILLEGGVNDANTDYNAPIGTIDPYSYDPADFDTTDTMAGGMEWTIYNAIKDHGDTAAFGYIALYEMPAKKFSNSKNHLEAAMAICDKWGIPYVDFYNEPIEGFDAASGAHTSDGCHAIAEGYDLMQPRINELCLEMRPVSKEIYDIVQQTELVNTELVG